jgi:hypothetical protein
MRLDTGTDTTCHGGEPRHSNGNVVLCREVHSLGRLLSELTCRRTLGRYSNCVLTAEASRLRPTGVQMPCADTLCVSHLEKRGSFPS